MKRLLVFAVFVMAVSTSDVLLAQSNPFVGTWKLNSAKSKYTTGVAPKEITLTIQIVGGEDQLTENGTAPDGSHISFKYAFPERGGQGKVLEAGGNLAANPFDGISGKRTDDTFELSFTKGGKEMLHTRTVLSEDGKTLRETISGFVPLGHPVSGVLVWDKQ